MSNSLKLDNVTKIFEQPDQEASVIFNNITSSFNQDTSYAITGISGSGKSTLLSLLAGLDQTTSGKVLYNGTPVAQLIKEQPHQFFHRTVGIIFQMPFLLKELTVLENVILKGLIADKSLTECAKRGLELLDHVALANKAHVMPATLSGGEQQRVSIARALFSKPQFLLADEPTAHLDAHHRELILHLLCDYQQRESVGLIISTHDPFIAQRMAVHREIQACNLRELRSKKS